MLDEIEERGLGPMDVVEEDQERSLPCKQLEELARAPEELLQRELLATEPDRRGDSVDDVAAAFAHECGELGERCFRRIVLADGRGLSHGLDKRPEGDPLPVGEAATAQDLRPRSDPLDELVVEARLSDTRVADDGDEPAGSLGDRFLERREETLELGLAAYHRRVASTAPAFAGLGDRDEPVRGDTLGLALELERLDRLDLDGVAHEAVGQVSEQYLLLSRRLLQPCGDVDSVARDQSLARRGIPGDHLTGVHSGPVGQPDAPAAIELVVQLGQGTLHPESGTDRSDGVVLVQLR